MKKDCSVSEIMTKELITLNVHNSLADAKKIFEKNKIRHIPIVSEKSIVGMLSYADILKISFPDTTLDEKNIETIVYDMFTIEQVMTKNLYLVPSNSTIKEVTSLISEKGFHALPVVEDGELVGIITSTDLLKYMIELL